MSMSRKLVSLTVAVLLALAAPASSQILLPNAQQTFLGANGTPLAGGFVFTYVPGTTTPKTTWQDSALSVPNNNPIVLDANGQARIWGSGFYRQVVQDSIGNLVWDQITEGLVIPTNVSQAVLSEATLAASATATFPNGVMRYAFSAGVGAPLYYTPLVGSCATNGLVSDGGSCVDTTAGDGNAWKAQFAGTVRAVDFGVSSTFVDTVNNPALIAASKAAYNVGLPLDLCIGGSSAVTVPIDGVPLYGGMNVKPCALTTFKMMVAGPSFYTMPTPSSTLPGSSYASPLVIGDGLNVDQNGKDGTPLLIEGFWSSRIGTLITHNVGTGTWLHNDGANTSGSYLDAAMVVKNISTSPAAGAFYTEIGPPIWLQPGFVPGQGPASITGGIGLLLTTTAGASSANPNVTRITGGQIRGFSKGVFIQSGSDFTLRHTDLSENTYGAVVGDPTGYNITINRTVFDHPYLESTTAAPEYIGIWFTSNSQLGKKYGTASTSNVAAACINDNNAQDNQCNAGNLEPNSFAPQTYQSAQTTTYNPDTSQNGTWRVTLTGGGGAGGGCTASDATHNCFGSGGAAGGTIVAYCYDPEQMNFRGAGLVVGAGGTGTITTGNNGGDTTFTGTLPAYSAGTLTFPDWAALTAYTSRAIIPMRPTSFIVPTVGNAGAFEFAAITTGTSAAAHPVWPQTPGQTVVDGTVTWENIGPSTWSAGMTAFVDTSQLGYHLGTLIAPATAINAGQFFYMATVPGVTGGSTPTWKQGILTEVTDGTVIWETIARSIQLVAGGGKGGLSTVIANTASIELLPQIARPNNINGCTPVVNNGGTVAGMAKFNAATGDGHSGYGGSSNSGTGALAVVVNNSSTQQTGTAATMNGGGGSGAISALNAAGSNQNGGVGFDGWAVVESWAGSIP